MTPARVVVLASDDTRAVISANGDCILVRGSQAFSLRRREVERLVKAVTGKDSNG